MLHREFNYFLVIYRGYMDRFQTLSVSEKKMFMNYFISNWGVYKYLSRYCMRNSPPKGELASYFERQSLERQIGEQIVKKVLCRVCETLQQQVLFNQHAKNCYKTRNLVRELKLVNEELQ